MNTEFQRIARRDKKLPQCTAKKQRKTIEWARLEICSGKLEIPKDHFTKEGYNKKRSDDPTKEEEIKNRWQGCTEQLYEKGLNDLDDGNDVTHLEPDILECEVKWALGSITMNKATGGDKITGELFQMLKDDAVKVLHSIRQEIWKTQQWPQDWKRSVFIPIPKKGNAKEYSDYSIIAVISHVSKVILKILKLGFNST